MPLSLDLNQILLIAIIGLLFLIVIFLIVNNAKINKQEKLIDNRLNKYLIDINSNTNSSLNTLSNNLFNYLQANSDLQIERIDNSSKIVTENLKSLSSYLVESQKQNNEHQINKLEAINKTLAQNALIEEQKLDNLRRTIETNLTNIRQDSNRQLEQMRKTVDEKLQETLDTKLTQSFKTVSEQLENVYKGLGEMKNLATGVGDLKRVLTNVKTKGILGEIQLSAIIKDILNNSQYEENVNTNPNSRDKVEFAIKLPSTDESYIYLPVDSKFPSQDYLAIQNALENGDKEEVERARKQLASTLKTQARTIRDKYIYVPETTDFAIMFLPTEGLYSEACNLNMLEILQREYKVTITGPSTFAALLNSLQMGFKTLAIQKRSSEVWNLLGSVKTEFVKFEKVLTNAQQNIQKTSDDLDTLVGTRTRAINRHLKNIQTNTIPLSEFDQIENKEVD
ncbi:MAG: DNA recombination protein RmuC [Bacillota bacterium]|jgi:DNA recombination protein RmuC|nr:DNA recombination protein RmuC [Bacillota bacterium]NLL26973.1 DNA recombination protein RmuC [Erysipelotrichia bacterium]